MGNPTPQQFAARWGESKLKESAASQEHFCDLCRMLGHETPAEADPHGAFFTFEKGAAKLGGGEGWADVWFKGHFAWEYKGKHMDLDRAYRQLVQYREDLENPPLLIVSDMERFVVHCNFTGSARREYRFDLTALGEGGPAEIHPPVDTPAPNALEVLRCAFYEPEHLRPAETTDVLTKTVADYIGKVAAEMRLRDVDPTAAAHFLMKVMFCFFAEDIGLLPGTVFQRILEKTHDDPNQFARYAEELFRAMSQGGHVLLESIPRFDGGLFADADVIRLQTPELDLLLRAARMHWENVEPAIFGTLFERCLDPNKRGQIGRHYTYDKDIADIVEPVLVAPLQEKWDRLAARLDALDRSAKSRAQAGKLLRVFQDYLAEIRVLDPASGSGNFLYVALRRLLDLEKKVVNKAFQWGIELPFKVRPAQLHGLEINRFAHELASVVVWIGYLQWMRDNGAPRPKEPILEPIETIHLRDSILIRGKDGPAEPPWPEADFIIGNPPFLGGKKLRADLGDAYVDDLFTVYRDRVPRQADYCCYWFEKVRDYVQRQAKKKRHVRAGLLATQGIRGGANRQVLHRILKTGGIFMAWSDRPWVLDGANVRVSMIGFDDGTDKTRTLDGQTAPAINADLSSTADITAASVLKENLGIAFMGDTKVGPFDITPEQAGGMLGAPNPHGRPNSDVIRPWANGMDVTRRTRGMWIIDFPPGMKEGQAALYEAPFDYVLKNVKPFRATARSGDATGVPWWIHQRPRPDMRSAIARLQRFLVTPRVAKHRLFVWFPSACLPDCQLIVFARIDDYFMGTLQSRVHEVWSDAQGSQLRELESGRRYTPTTCFETFPFPWPVNLPDPPTGKREVHRRIAEAAKRLDELRRGWVEPDPGSVSAAERARRTMTNLYNRRPAWLENAHADLDRAVLDAYDWPQDIAREDILSRLLALNLSRST